MKMKEKKQIRRMIEEVVEQKLAEMRPMQMIDEPIEEHYHHALFKRPEDKVEEQYDDIAGA